MNESVDRNHPTDRKVAADIYLDCGSPHEGEHRADGIEALARLLAYWTSDLKRTVFAASCRSCASPDEWSHAEFKRVGNRSYWQHWRLKPLPGMTTKGCTFCSASHLRQAVADAAEGER